MRRPYFKQTEFDPSSAQDRARLWAFLAAAIACSFLAAACQPARWQETRSLSPNGARASSSPLPAAAPLPLQTNARGREYVVTSRVPGHRDPRGETAAYCALENDRVLVLTDSASSELVEVQPLTAAGLAACGNRVWIRRSGVETAPASVAARRQAARFVVINVATGRLRVYSICRAERCDGHRLDLDVPAVVGPNLPGRRTWLGEYELVSWFKFYSDNARRYPPFYAPSYPELPRAGASIEDWLSPSLLPAALRGRPGLQRGNFGWYTAHLAPNADGQWIQGTWGWGADGDRFIRLAREGGVDGALDLQTHGCARVDNPTIAYLRHILPLETPVIRVYAREEMGGGARPTAPAPDATWDYVLTKQGVDTNGPGADRAEVERSNVPASERLDSGSYAISRRPVAASGNPYQVRDSEMRGVFYPDKGLFNGYAHPASLQVGGFEGRVVPRFAVAP